MNWKIKQKQKGNWRAWAAPVIVSTCVFAILGAANLISETLAGGLAVVIVVIGVIALRAV